MSQLAASKQKDNRREILSDFVPVTKFHCLMLLLKFKNIASRFIDTKTVFK